MYWGKLELNCAGHRPSRTKFGDPCLTPSSIIRLDSTTVQLYDIGLKTTTRWTSFAYIGSEHSFWLQARLMARVWVCWHRGCGVPFCHPTSSGIQNVCTVSLQARQTDKTPQYKLLYPTTDPSFTQSSCLSGLCTIQGWIKNYFLATLINRIRNAELQFKEWQKKQKNNQQTKQFLYFLLWITHKHTLPSKSLGSLIFDF